MRKKFIIGISITIVFSLLLIPINPVEAKGNPAINALELAISEIYLALDVLEEQISDLELAFQSQLELRDEAINAIDTRLLSIEEGVTNDIDERIGSVELDVSSLDSRVTTNENNIAVNQADISILESTVAGLGSGGLTADQLYRNSDSEFFLDEGDAVIASCDTNDLAISGNAFSGVDEEYYAVPIVNLDAGLPNSAYYVSNKPETDFVTVTVSCIDIAEPFR